jgi:hypothetical protein
MAVCAAGILWAWASSAARKRMYAQQAQFVDRVYSEMMMGAQAQDDMATADQQPGRITSQADWLRAQGLGRMIIVARRVADARGTQQQEGRYGAGTLYAETQTIVHLVN